MRVGSSEAKTERKLIDLCLRQKKPIFKLYFSFFSWRYSAMRPERIICGMAFDETKEKT